MKIERSVFSRTEFVISINPIRIKRERIFRIAVAERDSKFRTIRRS